MSKNVKALMIHPNGDTMYELIPDDLEYLQWQVGGNIEYVSLKHGHLYCNEDGIALGLEINDRATILAELAGWIPTPGDYLKGIIIFLGHDDEGEEQDVPQEIVDLWMSI